MRIIQAISTALAWICVATVALEGGVAAIAWANGQLNLQKINDIVAVAYGVDELTIQTEIEAVERQDDSDQPSYEDVVQRRWMVRLNLDLREMAVDKALMEGEFLRRQLHEQEDKYHGLRNMFMQASETLAGAAEDTNLLEVARTLVSLPPKQAKDEILRWLSDNRSSEDQRLMNDLVTIIKAMPLDKRKKILIEFKTADEAKQLGDVLQKIRLGIPRVDLIRQTRQQLHEFDSKLERGDKEGDAPA